MTAVEKQIIGYLADKDCLKDVRSKLSTISGTVKKYRDYASYIAEEVEYTQKDLPKAVAAVRKRFHVMENKDFCHSMVDAFSTHASDYTEKSIKQLQAAHDKKASKEELTDICNLLLLKLAAAFFASGDCMINPISELVDEDLNNVCNRPESKMFSVYAECANKILREYHSAIKEA